VALKTSMLKEQKISSDQEVARREVKFLGENSS
jgi:hypothetical protein